MCLYIKGENEHEKLYSLYFVRVEKKLDEYPNLKEEYEKIVKDQLEEGIVEAAPETPTGERTFYMPHKPVVRETASTTEVRMVFDASAQPHPLVNSINKHGSTSSTLTVGHFDQGTHVQTHHTSRYSEGIQIGVREEDRDAFRFLFNISGREKCQSPLSRRVKPILVRLPSTITRSTR